MRTHLFLGPGHPVRKLPAGVESSPLPAEPAAAARAIESVLDDKGIDVLVFWDLDPGQVPWHLLDTFRGSLDDAWLATRAPDANDLLKYAEPVWVYRRDPSPQVTGAVAWKLDPRAAFVRAATLRAIGGLDPSFETITGAMRELGLRLFDHGAICRQWPLTPTALVAHEPSLADQYRILRRRVSHKWQAYSLARRVLDEPLALPREVRAWRASDDRAAPRVPTAGALQRDLDAVKLPEHVTASVVLPTFGRYRYVAEVLDDLRAQTIRPTQILIADGNPPAERQPDVYERYRDLPIEVLWHEEPGICSGRNACLARATGELVWFVDDDSRFDPRNLEMHVRTLLAYGADISVGPAYTKGRPQLAPEQRETKCAFMDCGTTVCRRAMLAKVGGFDMQFNHYLRGEDNDLGIRFVRAGGVMLNNPHSQRFHYLAPVGGSRTKGSPHVFDRWSLRPRPVQSIYYLARRHFEASAAWDSLLQNVISVGWRRPHGLPATRAWRFKNLVAEVVAAPLTALRLYRSYRVGHRMFEEGPRIPAISGDESARSSAC